MISAVFVPSSGLSSPKLSSALCLCVCWIRRLSSAGPWLTRWLLLWNGEKSEYFRMPWFEACLILIPHFTLLGRQHGYRSPHTWVPSGDSHIYQTPWLPCSKVQGQCLLRQEDGKLKRLEETATSTFSGLFWKTFGQHCHLLDQRWLMQLGGQMALQVHPWPWDHMRWSWD